MAFCTYCGLRLTPMAEKCPYCDTATHPYSQEYDSHAAIITMPPEHVLKRRKAFPIRDALYLPPESSQSRQGVRIIRKTHWYALVGLFLICLCLLVSIYSLLSTSFRALQGLLVPAPGSPTSEITSVYHEASMPYTILPTQPALSAIHKKPATHLTSVTRTAFQGAKEVIIHYYQNINSRDYQKAYALWLHNPYDYLTFSAGFAHTQHDTIIFDLVTRQSATLVRIALTIRATERVFNDAITQLSSYQGYYLIQQQSNRSWKIVAANFSRL